MNLHDRNQNFSWSNAAPPFEIVTEEQARLYNEIGAFALDNVFSTEEVSELKAILDPLEAASNKMLLSMQEKRLSIARADEIVFRPHAVKTDARLKEYAAHPILAGLCRDLVGPKVRLYWDQIVYKRPGTKFDFPWHQDNGYTYVEPQQYLTCWVALTDVTKENGCPWIAPGFHLRGTLRHEWTEYGFRCLDQDPVDPIPLELTAGSIAVFSSLSPHRTGPNLTGGIRKAYILQYAVDGAIVHSNDGTAIEANDPDRQFLV